MRFFVSGTAETGKSEGGAQAAREAACAAPGGHEWEGCVCSRCGAKRDEGHVWKDQFEVISSYEMAASYESGNEYAPYHTEHVYGDKAVGRTCSKCGRTEEY